MSIHRSSFTGTYDGVTVRLWANGLEVGNGVVAPGVVTYGLAISDNFFFGKPESSYRGAFQGFDNIRVWDKAFKRGRG